MGVKILDYLKSKERKKRVHRVVRTHYRKTHVYDYDGWLRKLPTVFQAKKARNDIVKKLENILRD
jgi:hypothetical protein